jgi:hypothetical protein
MPRNTTPVEIAKIKGMQSLHPERYLDSIPKSDLPLGLPPKRLTDEAQECWWEISFYAIPGIMTGADRLLLETLSNHLAEYRKDPNKYPVNKVQQMITTLGRFGMSPSDRTKLGQPLKPKDNPFAKLDD